MVVVVGGNLGEVLRGRRWRRQWGGLEDGEVVGVGDEGVGSVVELDVDDWGGVRPSGEDLLSRSSMVLSPQGVPGVPGARPGVLSMRAWSIA